MGVSTMLRETRAKLLAALTAVLVVWLAALFAWLRNVPAPAQPPPARAPAASVPASADAVPLDAAQRAFERLNCALCHAIAGRGNPARPLDGIGARMDAASIRAWAVGTGAARDQLPASIARMKARAADDPELDSLVDYLADLK
jgi:hypothetical protein